VRWEPPAAGGGEHCEDERVAGVDHCSPFALTFLLNITTQRTTAESCRQGA
jgi:hypothetical protein